MRKAIRRGDLFYADLNPVVGSEQGGIRPVLVIQNDVGNHFSPTVVAAAITSRKAKNSLPTHILLENVPGLAPTSLLLLEQLRTIDRQRLRGYIGRISKEKMLEVDAALAISIGIGYPNERRTQNVYKFRLSQPLPCRLQRQKPTTYFRNLCTLSPIFTPQPPNSFFLYPSPRPRN